MGPQGIHVFLTDPHDACRIVNHKIGHRYRRLRRWCRRKLPVTMFAYITAVSKQIRTHEVSALALIFTKAFITLRSHKNLIAINTGPVFPVTVLAFTY